MNKFARLLNSEKGQLSAEMLLLIAAVAAVAYVLISSMSKTAVSAGENLDKATGKIGGQIEDLLE